MWRYLFIYSSSDFSFVCRGIIHVTTVVVVLFVLDYSSSMQSSTTLNGNGGTPSSSSSSSTSVTSGSTNTLKRLQLKERLKSFIGIMTIVIILVQYSPSLLVCIIVCIATGGYDLSTYTSAQPALQYCTWNIR
jgi:hypothetical protein